MYRQQTVENIVTIVFVLLTTKIEIPCRVTGSFSMSLYVNKTVPENYFNGNLEDGMKLRYFLSIYNLLQCISIPSLAFV